MFSVVAMCTYVSVVNGDILYAVARDEAGLRLWFEKTSI